MKYKLVKSSVELEGKTFKTYGVSLGNTVINDISHNRKKIENFVEMLNRNNVSITQLDYVVEDFLENCQ